MLVFMRVVVTKWLGGLRVDPGIMTLSPTWVTTTFSSNDISND